MSLGFFTEVKMLMIHRVGLMALAQSSLKLSSRQYPDVGGGI
jgi:hypothetical protein